MTILLMACGPAPLEGRVVLSGSATLAPLATRAVDEWKKLHPGVETRVEIIGSDAGLERLVRYSDADLALVSRPLVAQDHETARTAGKTLVPLPLAWDAVCLVVPTSNTWAHSLTRNQVSRAFLSADLWSDLDPSWPAQPIHRFVLGPQSGTADVFATGILGGNKATLYTSPGVQASEDDRILARGISQVDGALGFLGWSTVRDAKLPLRTLALEGVDPTPTSILDGSYGLPRSLWLVATQEGLDAHPAVRSFIQFLYDHYQDLTAGTGLVPLSEDERNRAEAGVGPH